MSVKFKATLPSAGRAALNGLFSGTMTQRKQAGDKGAGLLTWMQGLAPARRDSYRAGRVQRQRTPDAYSCTKAIALG